MDRDRAIELLPEDYATALRLHEAGHDAGIAERLEIRPEAVGPLLRLARAKLATLVAANEDAHGSGHGPVQK